MTGTWMDHCPIEEGVSPVERETWRKGWEHRKEHGLDEETALNVMAKPLLLSVWLDGYSAADRHERDH